MKNMDLENLCFRFFQDVYGNALDSANAEAIGEVYKKIADYNEDYLEACKMELQCATKVVRS